ncbi:pyridoxamine 5'-phosphate oxidase family protein [Rothia terrae]|uniref:pyridoxamine 5'-phosphate oxidase family protein n=1 Tax=Rothia terrae TaxID=396015 RepID=UPI00144662C8|nr:pyridoxamine 5'-phosphate oxidase family protein [Rothia terrae]MDT0189936.1 pyridoxamine 5'-phosphate oxidase family protein [Rothia terrae]NKZ34376.1 pyridoxamine 5'-phosphate oxidase family protein [Rothia terrae]
MSIPMNISKDANEHSTGVPENPVTVLTDDEIWALAEHQRFARLGTADEGVVHITPLNIAVADRKFYFQTAPGSKLTQLILNDKATLQFDNITGGEAYSVNVFGTARLLTDTADIERASTLGIRPWLNTVKLEFVEITPDELVGRRFVLGTNG